MDILPPTISLDAAVEAALPGAVLGPGEQVLLTGQVQDDHQAGAVEICFPQTYGQVLPISGCGARWARYENLALRAHG